MLCLSFVSDLAANMIGRSNARRGARRIFAVLQNRRLNQHIIYTIVDEVWLDIYAHTLAVISAYTGFRCPISRGYRNVVIVDLNDGSTV